MFTNTDNVIDSRDIIERIEELESILSDLWEVEKEDNPNIPFDVFLETLYSASNHIGLDVADEYKILKEFAEECEQYSSDWEYGETLIHRDYFADYMDEMVEDCYELPKDLPYWMTIKLDYDALEQDYTSVYFDGEEYLIRSF